MPRWQAAICPNPRCHRILVQMTDVTLTGTIVFQCKNRRIHCTQRSVLGDPGTEVPSPLAVILVHSQEEYARYREAAMKRLGGQAPLHSGRQALA